MSDDLIPINVWLSGRSYRLKVRAKEEEIVRAAVKLASEKITEFKNNYAGKDEQDFLAMVLLMYAIDSSTENSFDPLSRQLIADMSGRIDLALDDSKEKED